MKYPGSEDWQDKTEVLLRQNYNMATLPTTNPILSVLALKSRSLQ